MPSRLGHSALCNTAEGLYQLQRGENMRLDFLQVFFSSSLHQQCLWLNFSAKWKPLVYRVWAVRWCLPAVPDQALTPLWDEALCSPPHGWEELTQLPGDQGLEVNCPLLCPLHQALYFAPLQPHRLVLSASAPFSSQTPCKLIS